jgi:hypothetical protein
MEELDYIEDPLEEKLLSWENQLRSLTHAYMDRPPTEYVVDKYFATHSLNIIYGAPATMKSMVMADLCGCIVTGNDWLRGVNGDGTGIPTHQGAVLWLDMDNGQRRTDQRFDAIGTARNLPPDAPLHYLSMPNPPFYMSDEMAVGALIRLARDQLQAKMIVIDNLGLITGTIEENSAQMAGIMGFLRILAERTGAAVVVVHHQRKGGSNGGRAGDALRGHSSIEAAIDLALHVLREPDSQSIRIQSTKTRGVDVPPVTAHFNYDHKPGTHDLEKAWFEGVAEVRGDNPIRDAIIAALEDNGEMTQGMLVDTVHEMLKKEVGVLKIRNRVKDMLEVTGELTAKKGAFNSLIIALS